MKGVSLIILSVLLYLLVCETKAQCTGGGLPAQTFPIDGSFYQLSQPDTLNYSLFIYVNDFQNFSIIGDSRGCPDGADDLMINGIALNQNDSLMYGIAEDPLNGDNVVLYRIGYNGSIEKLTVIKAPQIIGSSNVNLERHVGTVADTTLYYFRGEVISGGTPRSAKFFVDLNNNFGDTTIAQYGGSIEPGFYNQYAVGQQPVMDWAYNICDDNFYSITNRGYIIRIGRNASTNIRRSDFAYTNNQLRGSGGIYGTIYFGPDCKNLYVQRNGLGQMWRINTVECFNRPFLNFPPPSSRYCPASAIRPIASNITLAGRSDGASFTNINSLEKTVAPGIATMGQIVEYSFLYYNTDVQQITNVNLNDTLDDNRIYVPGSVRYLLSTGGSWSTANVDTNNYGRTNVLSISNLEVPRRLNNSLGTIEVRVKAVVPYQLNLIGDTIFNQASTNFAGISFINSKDEDGLWDSPTPLAVEGFEPVTMTKSAGRLIVNDGSIDPGDLIEYTLNIRNPNNGAYFHNLAYHLAVYDTLTGPASFVPGSITTNRPPICGSDNDCEDNYELFFNPTNDVLKIYNLILYPLGQNNYSPRGSVQIRYRVRVDANATRPINIDNVAEIIAEPFYTPGLFVPLPVELGYFKAEAKNADIITEWLTYSEINNSGFELQHSRDAINFEKVAFISGKGTTNDISRYQFTLRNMSKGVHYLRLKQIDFDGTFEYSSIESVSIETDAKPSIVAVTGTDGIVYIHFNGFVEELMQYQIFNTQGKLMGTSDFADGGFMHQLQIDNLSTGVYFLHTFINGEWQGHKFFYK